MQRIYRFLPEKSDYFCSLFLTHYFFIYSYLISVAQHLYRKVDAYWKIIIELVHRQAHRKFYIYCLCAGCMNSTCTIALKVDSLAYKLVHS